MELLTAAHLHKSYARHKALDDVSLSVPKQSIFGLLGPNGAGKTTLIRIVTQIIEADQGEIIFNGERLKPEHISQMGYLPEERGLYKKMKVGEQLLYLSQLKGMSRSEAISSISYWFKKFDISDWSNKNIEDLSKGMQQKVQFIATVVHAPSLIILDEPFSGFDPINANLIRDEILELREKGSTIIFSTHRMESVEELCDHIALINKSKKILDGPKKQIKNEFRDNIFQIEHTDYLSFESENATIIEQVKLGDNQYRTNVQVRNGLSANSLLQLLINKVQINSFTEKIPTFNEIFIQKVKEEI